MKDLIKYLRHYIKESILAPLFKMLEASFELFVPLVMAAIIDTGIKNSDKPYIFKMGMVLVGLAIVKNRNRNGKNYSRFRINREGHDDCADNDER